MRKHRDAKTQSHRERPQKKFLDAAPLCGFMSLCLGVSFAAATDRIICALAPNTSSYNAYSDQRPAPDAMQLSGPVNASLAAVCIPNCPRISLFRNSTSANAMVIDSGGKWKIVYKPEFFATVYDAYGEAGIQAILAHELGHAIDATTPANWIKGEWGPELRADAWTGCSLAKLNLNPRGLRAALDVLSKYPPVSALDWTSRLQVLRIGYMRCGGNGSKLP